MKTSVTFTGSGLRMAGILFTPEQPIATPMPAIVIGHPGGGVKEQSPSIYAERLARAGFAAFVFDAAYQGESEGEPRSLENPFQRAEDVKNAVSYLSTREDIDPERIGALGICASGGYVSYAVQTDLRVKAVATVSGTDMGVVMRDGIGDTQTPQQRQALLRQANAARTAEARDGKVVRQEWVPHELPEGAPQDLQEVFDFYRTPRGFHPRAIQPWPVRNLDQMVQYDSWALIRLIAPRPLLMIIGSEAHTGYLSRRAIEMAGEPKELFVIDGATHYSLYDQDEHVTPAVARMVEFFSKNL
ncbi:alpha/beta hydrolase [Kineosporia babensis]|uniref:Alpha/beta hydrolase n=1 Tax=Kineosporia babensis TaxID=499548 RepID=A0A9X1SWG4_9ACTN|nr:alpha/beta hydrolase [Kineosporia babensis]MCD5314726.1 alpha/beta hydrolase [Kineosporia babensis]